MSHVRPYNSAYQDFWTQKGMDRRTPIHQWQRVALLAYGRRSPNGHAVFEKGELANLLGKRDLRTGEVIEPLDAANLRTEIRRAVKYGWLVKGSRSRCLIVPSEIFGGPRSAGKPTDSCPIHEPQSRKRGSATHPQTRKKRVSHSPSHRVSHSPSRNPLTCGNVQDPSLTLSPTPTEGADR